MSLCVDMKELSTSIGKLNALLELNLSWCSSLQKLLAKITCIYLPIECTPKP